ncbi:MAG: putative manganese-dependent inorganic diphosphatase [Candidatus Xiphinematobacter sp.]|nr:MAG: putative manganese-dependent inorganic diphosphatase [Candidatus Xiphinematobacter sp.]
MRTFIVGHRNPDVDAICSALAYAAFKHAHGETAATAARCGNTNQRIDYVLRRFGFSAPLFLSDVSPRVEDVMERAVVTAKLDEPILHALSRMEARRVRSLPVVDKAGYYVGMLSTPKLTDYLLLNGDRKTAPSGCTVYASLADICASLNAKNVGPSPPSKPETYSLLIGAGGENSFSAVLNKSTDLKSTIVIVGDRPSILEMAAEWGVGAILLVEGAIPTRKLVGVCRKNATALLLTQLDAPSTIIHVRCSVRTRQMLHKNSQFLRANLSLEEARRSLAFSPQFIFPVLKQGGGTVLGVFSKSDFLKPIPRQLILVDHNELSQAVTGASEVPIVEILDHHRLGSINTAAPILFINRPVGSTCTVVASCFQMARLSIPKNVAGILMAGIVSDTLNLTSPTTTIEDREILANLAKTTGISPSQLADEIFSTGSPLLTTSAQQAIVADCKEYCEQGYTFTVSQIEELNFSHLPQKQEGLANVLEEYRLEHGYLFSALLVTDINTQNSLLVLRGREDYLRQIDYPMNSPFIWQLDGIVSRKKQLLPYLSGLLNKIA